MALSLTFWYNPEHEFYSEETTILDPKKCHYELNETQSVLNLAYVAPSA